jgi:hypothetical protein
VRRLTISTSAKIYESTSVDRWPGGRDNAAITVNLFGPLPLGTGKALSAARVALEDSAG